MKSIIIFLILFIIKSSISKTNLNDFSINLFITTLKKQGIYQTILSVKEYYGQDLSIITCEELNKNHCGNCRKLVLEYMPSTMREVNPIKRKFFFPYIKQYKKIPTIEKILRRNLSSKLAKLISDDIINKAKERGIPIRKQLLAS